MTHGIGGSASALMGAEELGKNSSCGLTVFRVKVGPQLVATYFFLGGLFDLKYTLGGYTANAPLAYSLCRYVQQPC